MGTLEGEASPGRPPLKRHNALGRADSFAGLALDYLKDAVDLRRQTGQRILARFRSGRSSLAG